MVRTIFQSTNVPLIKRFWAIYLTATDKGGISALRLSKHIGVSWITAHRMLRKTRMVTAYRDSIYCILRLPFPLIPLAILQLFLKRHSFPSSRKWDGRDYSNALKGEEIPLSGRLMALADVSTMPLLRKLLERTA